MCIRGQAYRMQWDSSGFRKPRMDESCLTYSSKIIPSKQHTRKSFQHPDIPLEFKKYALFEGWDRPWQELARRCPVDVADGRGSRKRHLSNAFVQAKCPDVMSDRLRMRHYMRHIDVLTTVLVGGVGNTTWYLSGKISRIDWSYVPETSMSSKIREVEMRSRMERPKPSASSRGYVDVYQ